MFFAGFARKKHTQLPPFIEMIAFMEWYTPFMRFSVLGPVYPYRGGIAHHTTMLAQRLMQKHSVQVISYRRQYPGWLYPGQTDRDTSQEALQIDAQYLLDPLLPHTWLAAANQIKAFSPDALVLPWWVTFMAPYVGTLARMLHGQMRILLAVHNVMPHEERFFDRLLAGYAFSAVDGCLVMSGREQQRLRAYFPQISSELAPLPLMPCPAGDRLSQAEARRRLSLPLDEPVVLFFGIVRAYKGLETLIEAAGELVRNGRPVHILVAGEFWDPLKKYSDQVGKLGLENWVRLENRYIPNEEVAAYFSAADCFAAPHFHGSQSGALRLAAGYGLPLVVSQAILDEDIRSLPGVRLESFPPGGVNALASAVMRLLDQPTLGAATKLDTEEGWQRQVQALEKLAQPM